MAAAGFKPLGPSRIIMDTSLAMSLLGFASSTSFDHAEIEDIQAAFMKKVLVFEQYCKSSQNPRTRVSKRDELRRVNEAYQYLIRKRRKLTGRAMHENWQLVGDKSNKAMDIISSLRFNTNSPFSRANKDEDQQQAESDFKRKQELESQAAKALAEELVMSAGLEMPVVDILSHANKNSSTVPGSLTTVPPVPSKSGFKPGKSKDHFGFLTEEKVRRPSAFVGPSHQNSFSKSSNSSFGSNSGSPLPNGGVTEIPSSSGAFIENRRSSRKGKKGSKKSESRSQPDSPPASGLDVCRDPEVVSSLTDLHIIASSSASNDRSTAIRPEEETMRKTLSNLDLQSTSDNFE